METIDQILEGIDIEDLELGLDLDAEPEPKPEPVEAPLVEDGWVPNIRKLVVY